MTGDRAAILAHGKNWELPVPADPADIEPSIESRMTAEAAGVLFTQGVGGMIIFSGGHTAGPDYPSEAAKMRETLYGYFGESDIPPELTDLEEESHDTASNLAIVKERMADYGVDSLILLTVGYHLPRVRRLARVLDVPVSGAFRSDHVIRERHGGANHLYARTVVEEAMDRRSAKPLVRSASAYALEAAGWGVSFIDPKGHRLGKLATSRMRHQA